MCGGEPHRRQSRQPRVAVAALMSERRYERHQEVARCSAAGMDRMCAAKNLRRSIRGVIVQKNPRPLHEALGIRALEVLAAERHGEPVAGSRRAPQSRSAKFQLRPRKPRPN